MTELSHDTLLREINEDIQRERYARLWQRYGKFIIAAVIALIAGIAAYKAWQYHQQTERQEAAGRFAAAVAMTEGDPAGAQKALADLGHSGPAGYALLARLRQAAALAEGGDAQAARGIYQDLQKTAPDALYRDLAVILETMLALEQEAVPADADVLAGKLKPLLAEGNAWRYTARELTAVIAWRGGQTTEARSLLSALAADPQAPPDMRERAKQFLAQSGDS